jgi:HEAT repeat protein
MQQFLLTALGNLGQASSVRLLTTYATDSQQPRDVRRGAINALVLMRKEPSAGEAIPELIPLLEDPEPVLRLSATVAIGALATPGDAVALAALTRAYRNNDREMSWNAALALGRIGSDAALPLLKDMLTRRYWESQKVDMPGAERPGEGPRRLTPTQIESYLIVTIDAVAGLHDKSLQPLAQQLKDDPSLQVRDRARKAVQKWSASQATP